MGVFVLYYGYRSDVFIERGSGFMCILDQLESEQESRCKAILVDGAGLESIPLGGYGGAKACGILI